MPRPRWYVWLTLAATLAAAAMPAAADVKPHPLFSDNAVLQSAMPLAVWGTADDGEKVTVRFQGQTATAAADGRRWSVRLEPLEPGGPAEMTISGNNAVTLQNVLVGEVWISSGQSNMAWTVTNSDGADETIAQSANAKIRLFTVPRAGADEPLAEIEAAWAECGPETVGSFSAVGYYFGKHLQEKLNVPVGLINTSYGGTPAEAWTSREVLASEPELKDVLDAYAEVIKRYPEARRRYEEALAKWKEEAAAARKEGKPFERRRPQPPTGPDNPRRPAALYNAMIAPLEPFALRGAIWYQGESNAGRAYQYRTLFPAMIRCWRDAWPQGDFPFLFVQLAPFMKIEQEPSESAWAELREAQLLTMLRVPNTAMAVITDVGEEDNIHPKKKEPVGDRLALAARALAYGEKIEYSGPVFSKMEIDGGKAVLSFDHLGGGLVAEGGKLAGFAVCGEDRRFVNADAEIRGDKVIVSSPEVPKPAAVRYGWANYPLGNLWNRAGLPASPFRTDDFPGVTQQ